MEKVQIFLNALSVSLTSNMYQGKTENIIQSNSVRHTMEKVQHIVGEFKYFSMLFQRA